MSQRIKNKKYETFLHTVTSSVIYYSTHTHVNMYIMCMREVFEYRHITFMYILCLLILDKIVEVYKLTNDNIKFGWFCKLYYLYFY